MQPRAFDASLLAALKPGGRLAIIDFQPEPRSSVPDGVPEDRGGHGIPVAVIVSEYPDCEPRMSEMTYEEWERVADAMVVWTGKGELAWPQLDDSRVIARFGSDSANELLPVLRRLYEEFYTSAAYLKVASLSEMSAMASAQFREKYPLARPSMVDALAWCYTFDYK